MPEPGRFSATEQLNPAFVAGVRGHLQDNGSRVFRPSQCARRGGTTLQTTSLRHSFDP